MIVDTRVAYIEKVIDGPIFLRWHRSASPKYYHMIGIQSNNIWLRLIP